MFQGLPFGFMVVVAIGTALYCLIQGMGQEKPQGSRGWSGRSHEGPQCSRRQSEPHRRPPRREIPSRTVLERRQKRRNEQNEELSDQEGSQSSQSKPYRAPPRCEIPSKAMLEQRLKKRNEQNEKLE